MENTPIIAYCATSIILGLALNAGFIIGQNIIGKYTGYPGQGTELLEIEIKILKNIFFPRKK